MFYCLYKITNWFNGKIYIGVHRTENLDDGYMGSGPLIKDAIKKYGLEYFTKDILQQFDSAEAMFEAESQIVNEEFVKSQFTYNLQTGGGSYFSGKKSYKSARKSYIMTEETKQKIANSLKGRKHDKERRKNISIATQQAMESKEIRQNISEALKNRKQTEEHKQKRANSNRGKKRTEETRRKISEAAKNRPPVSKEIRKKLSDAAKNISEETRKKMSESQKRRFKK